MVVYAAAAHFEQMRETAAAVHHFQSLMVAAAAAHDAQQREREAVVQHNSEQQKKANAASAHDIAQRREATAAASAHAIAQTRVATAAAAHWTQGPGGPSEPTPPNQLAMHARDAQELTIAARAAEQARVEAIQKQKDNFRRLHLQEQERAALEAQKGSPGLGANPTSPTSLVPTTPLQP